MKNQGFLKISMLTGLYVLSAMSFAGLADTSISIDRALNSPTVTIRYSGARASMIELLVNGQSVATRTLGATKAAGETNFTLDLTSLRDGSNTVEVRLFGKEGQLLGSQKTDISTDDGAPAPFFMNTPKVGATLEGPVEISVGFNQAFKSSYVSFFVDNRLKSMSNTPPFTYLWDTSRETNGWHELESWLVDDSSTTFKTRKVRVFVNNPSGHTRRRVAPKTRPLKLAVPVKPQPQPHAVPVPQPKPPAPQPAHPAIVVRPLAAQPFIKPEPAIEAENAVRVHLSGATTGLKPTPHAFSLATGMKHLTPTGHRYSLRTVGPVAKPLPNVGAPASLSHLIRIVPGTRLPNLGTFAIVMNNEFVDFDVSPRVDDGVPMTPLRYLLEKAGGKVGWNNGTKTVSASADGRAISITIGNSVAMIDKLAVRMERTPYIEASRTIVPLSFIQSALKVDVSYDKASGHVLITSVKK